MILILMTVVLLVVDLVVSKKIISYLNNIIIILPCYHRYDESLELANHFEWSVCRMDVHLKSKRDFRNNF